MTNVIKLKAVRSLGQMIMNNLKLATIFVTIVTIMFFAEYWTCLWWPNSLRCTEGIWAFGHIRCRGFFCNGREGESSYCQIIFDRGNGPNTKYLHNYTALHVSCQKGNLDVAKVLTEKGANINAKGVCQETALDLAAKSFSLAPGPASPASP